MSSTWHSFPQRVYNVLKFCEEQGREDIISWENDGTAFKVNHLEEFERDLLPRYFNTNKYNTFTRSLYAYGFTCVRTGRQPGIYSHPSFTRNEQLSPSLVKRIPRKKPTSSHADSSNPFLEALKSRPSSGRPGISNGHPKHKFSSFFDDRGRENHDSDIATVFGRSYHTIPSQGDDADARATPTLPPVQISEAAGTDSVYVLLDSERDSMNTRSYQDSTPSTTTSTTNPTSSHPAAKIQSKRR